MQVRVNGQGVRRPADVRTLVPDDLGTAPWRIELDGGNGLRLEAISRHDGRFALAYFEKRQRYQGPTVERATLLETLRAFAAREPGWRHAGPWTFEAPPAKPTARAGRPAARSLREMERDERHASIAGIVVLGGAALLALLQIVGVKFRVPEITLPGPLNSTGAKALLAAFLLFWLFFAFAAGYKLWEIRRARGWKRAQAVITASDIGTDVSHPEGGIRDVRRVAQVTYRFAVGGRAHEGSRLTLAERPAAITREELERRYPVGKVVEVYYDPADPDACVLDRDLPAGAAKGCLIATFVAVPVILVGMVLLTSGPAWVRTVLPNAQPHVFLLALVAALVAGLYAWGEHRRRGLARHWPNVSGTVVSSTVTQQANASEGAARSFVPRVVYRYTVAGETYHHDQIRLGFERGGSADYAEHLRAAYPEGAQVTVHYDPTDPQDAALEWDETVPKIAGAVAAVLLAVAAVASGLLNWP
jgi:hypothetical protein